MKHYSDFESRNSFHGLQSNKDLNEHNEEDEILTVKKRLIIPPIVITNKQIDEIKKFLADNSIIKYKIKIQSMGIKLLFENNDDYNLVSNVLAENPEFKYYTFENPNNNPVKITLSGLPNFNIEELKTSFSEEKIPVPHEIKKLNIKKKRYDQQTVYLLYYRKGEITLNELKKFKSVCNIIVVWNYYHAQSRGPTQCRKCQLFGHGTANCHLDAKCRLCGENHQANDCPLNKIESEEKQIACFKCANCGKNHTANDSNCPKKTEYIQMKKNLQNKYNKPQPTRQTRPPVSDINNFPALPAPRQSNWWKTSDLETNQQSTTSTQADDLFSIAEISHIVQEVIGRFQLCKSRNQQLQVIFEISAKYCYGGNK